MCWAIKLHFGFHSFLSSPSFKDSHGSTQYWVQVINPVLCYFHEIQTCIYSPLCGQKRLQMAQIMWCICLDFPHHMFLNESEIACLRGYIITLFAFVWLLPAVCFQMFPQSACLWWCIITLVTFVWLFSTVRFQMPPQMVYMRRSIVTLIALVWLFPTVGFQMCPQTVCPRRGKVALVALIWLFSTVGFQMCSQMACLRRGIVTLVAFV